MRTLDIVKPYAYKVKDAYKVKGDLNNMDFVVNVDNNIVYLVKNNSFTNHEATMIPIGYYDTNTGYYVGYRSKKDGSAIKYDGNPKNLYKIPDYTFVEIEYDEVENLRYKFGEKKINLIHKTLELILPKYIEVGKFYKLVFTTTNFYIKVIDKHLREDTKGGIAYTVEVIKPA